MPCKTQTHECPIRPNSPTAHLATSRFFRRSSLQGANHGGAPELQPGHLQIERHLGKVERVLQPGVFFGWNERPKEQHESVRIPKKEKQVPTTRTNMSLKCNIPIALQNSSQLAIQIRQVSIAHRSTKFSHCVVYPRHVGKMPTRSARLKG